MIIGGRRVLAACVLLGLSGIFGQWMQKTSVPTEGPFRVSLPFVRGEWEGNPYDLGSLIAGDVGPAITRQYRFQGGSPINLLILQNRRNHLPSVCYQGLGWRLADEGDLTSPSGTYRMAGLLGHNDSESEILVYYGVHVGDRIIKDGVLLKYAEVKQTLVQRDPDQYLIEVTMLFPKGQEQTAKAYLRKFMDDMDDLFPGIRSIREEGSARGSAVET
jgi:EpsI family protein